MLAATILKRKQQLVALSSALQHSLLTRFAKIICIKESIGKQKIAYYYRVVTKLPFRSLSRMRRKWIQLANPDRSDRIRFLKDAGGVTHLSYPTIKQQKKQ
jgi:hypothetical protein